MADIAGVKMADMKRSKASLQSGNIGKISPDPYSGAHRITLDQDALNKLGVTETPKVGDVFHVMGEGHVHSVSSDSSLAGSGRLSVGLQMRKMGIQKKAKGDPVAKGGTSKASGAFAAVSAGVKEADQA
jgi:hypothetical protein